MQVRFKTLLLPLLALAAFSGSVVSCQKSSPDPQPQELTLSLRSSSSTSSAGQTFVDVKAAGAWTLVIDPQIDWATVSQNSGSGNKSGIFLSWDANSESSSRSLTLVLSDGTNSVSQGFTQAGKGQTGEIVPDPVKAWMELPSIKDENLYFIVHPMTIGTVNTRNYSYYWDTANLVARWVAYPLNRTLRSGSCGRSDEWGLDPRVPRKYQPVIYSPFSKNGVRGHQIPSADRQIKTYNVETFYGTNMTPQDYDLNGGVWAQLEQYVRNRGDVLDTLYVVTGCTVKGSTLIAYDNDGKKVTVPTGYFKALLAYKKNKSIGITGRTGGYTGIGFYFENRDYSGSYMNEACTLSELESITGLDFFVNLPSNVKSTVKNTEDQWWYNSL